MRYLCSHCHARFEGEPDDEHKACPSCKAEAGLEPVKDDTPPAMRFFGITLLLLGVTAVGGLLAGMTS